MFIPAGCPVVEPVASGCPVVAAAVIRIYLIRAVVFFRDCFITFFKFSLSVAENKTIQLDWWLIPATALQLTLQPLLVERPSVVNIRLMVLLLLVMVGGKVEPHLFSIKVVPSPSVIVRWS